MPCGVGCALLHHDFEGRDVLRLGPEPPLGPATPDSPHPLNLDRQDVGRHVGATGSDEGLAHDLAQAPQRSVLDRRDPHGLAVRTQLAGDLVGLDEGPRAVLGLDDVKTGVERDVAADQLSATAPSPSS